MVAGRFGLLVAFHCHPKIGEQKPAAKVAAESEAWSSTEQDGTQDAARDDERTRRRQSQYERQFGYIFIVCASGKSAAEMPACYVSDWQTTPKELRVAAEEQRKITQLRLKNC